MQSVNTRKIREQRLLCRLGKQVRHLRLAHNISQKDLASGSGIGLSTLKRLENGQGCNLAALVQLLVALNCDDKVDVLFAQLAEDVAGSRAAIRSRASSPRKAVDP
ncbi:helix-turn-helix domain-containing protein [Microbulbifer thermotolerans]|uniref:helix-turn-helix domain-containing protein n=1 Tax=Microbulbifer thermotolerans TaxID=252514 RepID=UPI0022489D7F|nr:helix-turn-helix transcriptional regulator [Microbulbifer thermotolerans]MCX2795164.1 helix-turn-helix domain-containing protein [Microbulbifer thermotolerans]